MDKIRNRKIYLVRHGAVEFPKGIKRCIGDTELPLNGEGKRQAENLSLYFEKYPITAVFTSPLGRCQETAKILSGGRYPVKTEAGLRELNMGEWENLPLHELKEKYGKKLESEPIHGESRVAGLARFSQTIEKILKESKGDIVCVAHAGINCCYLAALMKKPLETSRALPQPYGGLSLIEVDEEGIKQVVKYGVMPLKAPDIEECERIWERYQTPEQVRAHCRAVCVQALNIGSELNCVGCTLNLKLIQSSALLHDVARVRADHAEEGAKLLRKEGYPEIAEIIRRHHNLPKEDEQQNRLPNEMEVVYLADKLTKEDRTVTLKERFEKSRKRIANQKNMQEALEAHEKRYREAKKIQEKIDNYLNLNYIVKNFDR